MSDKKDQQQHLEPERRVSQGESVATDATVITEKDKAPKAATTPKPHHHVDVPLSDPPFVGPFGGASPEGYDAELGLTPARSRAEAQENQVLEQKIEDGEDPWVVTFDEGDKRNPKVSATLTVWRTAVVNTPPELVGRT